MFQPLDMLTRVRKR